MNSDGRDPLICLRIPPPLNERLRAECDSTGATISEVVRDAIEQRLPLQPAARTQRSTQAKKAAQNGRCAHRVTSGSYCRRCDAVI